MASEGRMVSTSTTTATPAPGGVSTTRAIHLLSSCAHDNPPVLTSPRFLLPTFARSCRHVTPSGSRLLPTFKGHSPRTGKEPFFLWCHPSDPTTLTLPRYPRYFQTLSTASVVPLSNPIGNHTAMVSPLQNGHLTLCPLNYLYLVSWFLGK